MARYVVVKGFTRAVDEFGVKTEDVVPGDERDFGTATDGLLAEGFIEVVPDEPEELPAEAEPPAKRGPGRPRKAV